MKPMNKKLIRRGRRSIIKQPRQDGRGWLGETRLHWNEDGIVDEWEHKYYKKADPRAMRGSISFATILFVAIIVFGIIGIFMMYAKY